MVVYEMPSVAENVLFTCEDNNVIKPYILFWCQFRCLRHGKRKYSI